MPSKRQQRRKYFKQYNTSSMGCLTPIPLSGTDEDDSVSEANSQQILATPNDASSKKRGRPPKTPKGIPTKNIQSLDTSDTPRTSRIASQSSELNSPCPKKEKKFDAFQIQHASPLIDFSNMSTLKFATHVSSAASICKERDMPLFDNGTDEANKGPTLIEKLWNDLDRWLKDGLIVPYLCLLASKSKRCTVVVDSFATDPSRNTRVKPASRRIRNSCFVSQPEKEPEIFLMPMFFENPGHWALLIHDRVMGTVFLDSLAENPDRMRPQNSANTNRIGITRADLIHGVIHEFLPGLIGQNLPIQVPQGLARQPDGNSCGYYCCLFAESWLFNDGNLTLEPLDLIAEKKRILWHMNELYSTDNVEFHSRYATPQTDVAIDSLSLSEGDTDSVMSFGSSSSKQSKKNTGGRPTKQKRGLGRPKKTSTFGNDAIVSPQVGTQGSVHKPPPKLVQQSAEVMQMLARDTIDIPAVPNWNPDHRIATQGLLQAGMILQELWTKPNTWMGEDLIYAFQRYIASLIDDRHVMVLDPVCTRIDVQFGPHALPYLARDNCYNLAPDYDVLLMTVCFPDHFALIIFDRTERDSPQCLYIDPRPGIDRIYEKNYAHYDGRRLELITGIICDLTPGLTHADFRVNCLPGRHFTTQQDGINCGFFVCLYTESYLLNNASFDLPNLDINFQRRRIVYHLSQLMASNNVPYIPLKQRTNVQVPMATAGPMSEADLSGLDVILESVDASHRESSHASVPIISSRRSSRIRSVASSRSVTPDRQSMHSNASSTASQTKNNRITRRCHQKHKGLPCADFRANHTETYHDSGNLGDAICDYCGALLFAYEAEKRNGKVSSGACCNHGKVVLPQLKKYPPRLKELLEGKPQESLEFLDKENVYNSLLAFASISVGHHDSHLDTGTCFLLNGEFMRSISTMFPGGKQVPSFSQLYILDPAAAQAHREKNVKYGGDRVDKKLLAELDALLRKCHPLAKELMSFKDQYERELIENGPDAVAHYRFTILEARDVPKSIRDPTLPQTLTNLPDESEQGALFAVWTEYDHPPEQKGIWIENEEGKLMKIPPWHPQTDTLCYPLLFPWGDDGFHHKIPLNLSKKSGKTIDDEAFSVDDDELDEEAVSEEESVYSVDDDADPDSAESSTKQRQYASFRQYIRYRMRIRRGQKIHHIWSAGGGLGQKYNIDCAARLDSDRDSYLNRPELDLCSLLPENYLRWMAKNAGVASPEEIGSVVLFRQCHPGTRPHMQGKYYDATTIMARVRKPGYASFMFTFTANPRWPEIKRNFLHENQSTVNRPDLMCLIFEEKFQFLYSLMKRNLFGKIFAQISREYQKKYGGPHIHAVFESDILAIPENIENLIWAHIPKAPDPNDNSDHANFIRKVRELLPKHQFHDCGPRCLKNGRCTRGFPKPYSNETVLLDDRPARYKRPKKEDGGEVMFVQRGKKLVEYDNSRVSAYNPLILVLTETHHNIEFGYGKSGAYKYAAKYPFKATSFLYIKSEENDGKINVNEPKYYSKNYYRPATEAFDRIFGHKYAFLSHTVIRLNVHLPNKQRIYLKPGELKDKQAQQRLQQRSLTNQLPETPLSAYWKQWANDPDLKNILFEHMPATYSYNKGAQVWKKRQMSKNPKNVKKRKPIIGRICPISPRDPELFALYLLTRHFPGNPDHLKTVEKTDGTKIQCATFLEAARLRGLLDDNDVWKRTLQDASKSFMPNQMRQLLAQILVFGSTQDCLVDGLALWNEFIRHFYDSRCTDAQRPGREDRALAALERLLVAQGRCLSDYGLPAPSVSMVKDPSHGLKAYFFPQQQTNQDDDDVVAVDTTKFQNVQLNQKQQEFCDMINSLFDDPLRYRLHRLAGGGGTGKTFLLDFMLYLFREAGKKVMPVASTGMAATRFHSGGMTMHSMFRMGIQVERGKLPQIAFESFFARRIIEAEIIMLDEMTALNRVVFENADLICQQLCKDKRPFGGKIVIISGDWKQQLTVAEDSNPGAQIAACLQSSHLYPLFKKFELTQNMRLLPDQISHLEWLDKVGKGEFGEYVPIEQDMLVNSREELVEWVYDKGFDMSSEELLKRLVLAVTNRTVDLINASVLRQMKKPIVDYYSVDKALEEDPFSVNAADYDVAQINELNPTGVPAHHIRLCVGAMIVLLMNFIPGKGLCNGTRLVAKELTNDLISGEAITGGASGGTIFGINRVRQTHPAKNPHDIGFERFQFPVRLAYAMTIAKAQGQTCDRVGIDLTDQCWTHGQFYTALSRARSRQGIKIFVPNAKTDDQGRVLVRNVVSTDIDLD